MGEQPAVRVSKLGYVGFRTPDVARLVEYYTRVLDFVLVDGDDDGAHLTTGADHHCVVIERGEAAARQVVGYEIREDLDLAAKRLADAGHRSERRSDIGPGTPDVLVVEEPGTDVPLHLITAQDPSGVGTPTPLRPTKLGHVAGFAPELAPMQAFYQELLGFRWSDTIGDFFVFLRCNADHHAANFMASTSLRVMHHIAYEMRDPNHLIAMVDHLAKNGHRLHWGPGRHGPGHNLFTYHRDPDGNTIELFTQIDVMHDEGRGCWEPRPWHEEYPMGPRTWQPGPETVNIWGPLDQSALRR